MSVVQAVEQWLAVAQGLRRSLGDAAFGSWFHSVVVSDASGDTVTLAVPTRFLADRLRASFGEQIAGMWNAVDPAVERIVIEARPDLFETARRAVKK